MNDLRDTTMTYTDDQLDAVRAQARALRNQRPTTPKRGKTPEAKVKAEVEKYLKQIGALSLRTGAGLMTVGDRKFSMGRSGCSDLTVLLPGGYWLSVETKSAKGTASDLQRRYGETVAALGGLFVVARGRDDVRAALVGRFGEDTVRGWER
jgi:hypothetical protein